MFYLTYAEGFTSASARSSRSDPTAVIESMPAGMNPRRVSPTQAQIDLPPELIDNTEIGLRSDWLDGRLRFNATYFESDWDGMRVALLPSDAAGNTQPFPYNSGEGAGTASGLEFEVVWAPTDRLNLNYGLGLIDTEYIQAGVLTGPPGQASITGNYPGAPFAYAPEQSYSIGAQYEIPTPNGGRFLLVGNYGWRDDYARDAAYQRTFIDQNGNPVLEPAYGILNARFVYEPAARNFSVELWGKNLTDELYINGGFDTRDIWGYDFSIVGRVARSRREPGLYVLAFARPTETEAARGRLFLLRLAAAYVRPAARVDVDGARLAGVADIAAARRIADDLVAHGDRQIGAAAAVDVGFIGREPAGVQVAAAARLHACRARTAAQAHVGAAGSLHVQCGDRHVDDHIAAAGRDEPQLVARKSTLGRDVRAARCRQRRERRQRHPDGAVIAPIEEARTLGTADFQCPGVHLGDDVGEILRRYLDDEAVALTQREIDAATHRDGGETLERASLRLLCVRG